MRYTLSIGNPYHVDTMWAIWEVWAQNEGLLDLHFHAMGNNGRRFHNWLKTCNVDTNIDADNGVTVMHFRSEQDFLAFKLKYL